MQFGKSAVYTFSAAAKPIKRTKLFGIMGYTDTPIKRDKPKPLLSNLTSVMSLNTQKRFKIIIPNAEQSPLRH